MLVKVTPLSVDSSTVPKSQGQPKPPFVSLSESCCCQKESLIVFAPAGTVIDGLVSSVLQLSPYGCVVHEFDGEWALPPSASFFHVQVVAADVVHAFVVSKSSVKNVACVAETVGSGIAHAPRERVKSASVVAPRSIDMSQIIVLGGP